MIETIQYFFQNNFPPELAVFFISMIPFIECRGAIPFGIMAFNMPIWEVLAISIAGNMLPIPFILLLIRPVIALFKKTTLLKPLADWLEGKVEKNKDKVTRYSKWGLFFFVAIPVPGTGAWSGALIASLLDMRVKNAFPTILCGVLCASLIMTLGSTAVDFLISFDWMYTFDGMMNNLYDFIRNIITLI